MSLIMFEDKELTKPIKTCDFVEVEVGTSKSKEVYLANTNDKFYIINIKETYPDTDISIANLPNMLAPNESKPIVITFKPSLSRETGLHSDIFFTGKMVIP